jgi:nucleoside-diphosphate-sugar epimerase
LAETVETDLISLTGLEDVLSRPNNDDRHFISDLNGDLIVLGAGGKMGPSLARRARRAADEAGTRCHVIAVSRFGSREAIRQFAEWGVEAISCDLLERDQIRHLPECANVLFLAGRKFGSTENRPLTWATNTLLPALVAERFRRSRVVALSSGNVYPLAVSGATEETMPAPVGEYAQSVLGRERVLEYYSNRENMRLAIIRLNYAIDLRSGVLLDIGLRVWERKPVPLAMSSVNVIWQGDANSLILRALALASAPPRILNVTGPEMLRVRWIAERFGELFGIEPRFQGQEGEAALLSDSSLCSRLLGPPSVTANQLIQWQAEWVRAGLPTLDKPTHFEVRDGVF